MDLTQLANLGEFAGGIGVIATLLYLAREIRSSSRAAHSTAYHETVNQLVTGLQALMSERWNELYKQPPEDLSEVEQLQLGYPVAAILFGSENLLHLRQQGHMDSRVAENVQQNWYPVLQSDLFLEALRNRPGPLSRDLLEEVEASMRSPSTG